MRRNPRPLALAMIALCSCPLAAFAQSSDKTTPAPAYSECWKATFNEQQSGPTRMRTVGGADQSFTHSYDGAFRWVGKPKTMPVTITYRYCFGKLKEDGGAVLLEGKTVSLGRVGSVQLSSAGKGTPGYDMVSVRDIDIFDSLYGRFQGEGGKVTSLQVELDRQRMTTAVITHTTEGRTQTTTYMKGETVRDELPR
ncbi:MAG: hypothetical protein KF800_10580 [Lysobacter sp.]|nr:hypothetical protein [Lysobacter sp.]